MSNVKVIQPELQRYSRMCSAASGVLGMVENDRGEWVRYEDVQRLIIKGVFEMQYSMMGQS